MLEKLQGKKTIIGSLLISLLSAMYFADLMADGVANWLTEANYLALGGFVTGLTGVALRLGINGVKK